MLETPAGVPATAVCVRLKFHTTETAGLDLHQGELSLDIKAGPAAGAAFACANNAAL
jgi:hypothetical protein